MSKKGIIFIVFSMVVFILYGLCFTDNNISNDINKEIILDNFVGLSLDNVYEYVDLFGIDIAIEYEYSSSVNKDIVISQSIDGGSLIDSDSVVRIVVSKGSVPESVYQENGVNELGSVPIMMYHGIVDISNSDTKYIGGNVDKDGYNRTADAFRSDLEFYYKNGYRMISLDDYVNGIVDVELGKSPIVLTFDDGNENNFKVLGEQNGELVIDPNCAVGILEEFKVKYPDYGVTATFFVNKGLFEQPEYNEEILQWLVENGYDIGNHTMSHVDFTKIDKERAIEEVGGVYKILEDIIPNQYVSIVALPFGSPYKRNHSNYDTILNGEYKNEIYNTKAALRVGWEAELSVFDKDFDATFLKRIRAYDNNGIDFDIEMNFKMLESKKYVSDGDVDTIVILNRDKDRVISGNRKVIVY